ncbi:octanoyl-[acyl-carrier-protein]:protein N-octanoyltransferase LIPT2, mitochondrial-like [Diadema antillarum]|uniref:octanoyl-[acyl-carrier-protein]:protein N-octanoyltransferase LIPT2, mitochondrial-like n=1 Tax=Diadema antillarum TaxID=105358 RepID=UPI003A8574BD
MGLRRLVSVLNLGCISYRRAWDLQQKLVRRQLDVLQSITDKERRHEGTQDLLLLCTHSPVYTIGIRTKGYSPDDEERLRSLGANFFRTERGGLITFHGPGQLVAYPILDLTHYNRSVRWYVEQLEGVVIRTCDKFGIQGERSPHTGVWVGDRKIAAIGIHCSRYITSHGLALNCNTDLSWFDHIVPCGIEGKGVTSLSRELGRDVAVEDTIEPFLNSFSEQFGCILEDADRGRQGVA